jgi:hypothetical protein
MSVSVFGTGVTPLLKAIPVLFEKSDLLEFAFGAEPIIKLIAWKAASLKVDFIGAAPDFFLNWCVVCRGMLCMRLNGTCFTFQSHISLAFQCHSRVRSFRHELLSILGAIDISAPGPRLGCKSGPGATRAVSLVQNRKTTPAEGSAV